MIQQGYMASRVLVPRAAHIETGKPAAETPARGRSAPVVLLLLLGLVLGCATRAHAAEETAPPVKPKEFIYLSPAWSDRVVFYHSFEKDVNQPEINLLNGKLRGERTEAVEGLTGRAYKAPNPKEKKAPLQLDSPALSPNKPLTVMLWFRLDAPMKEETSFQLIKIGGPKGYISSFVHGKGEWCALKEPTYISQVHGFPDIRNHHNSWGGRVWFEPGEWHHAAITVANASEVRIYWDGALREAIGIKGRLFQEGDCTYANLDPNWLHHPMSIDEVIVCDRALTGDEITGYVTAVRALAALKYRVAGNE
jgi:hypothetical protein